MGPLRGYVGKGPIRRTSIIVVLTLTHMYGGRYNICKNWFYPLH